MKKSILLMVFSFLLLGCKSEQKIIFVGESIEYKNKDKYLASLMAKECRELSSDLDVYLKDGWKVVSSSAKEKVVAENSGTCKGTEYVIEK